MPGALRDELGTCLYGSIATTIAARSLDYIPGSVQWADFDPTATATAIATTDAAERLQPATLAWTFDEYLRGQRRRRRGEYRLDYSAHEIRILGALVRLTVRRCARVARVSCPPKADALEPVAEYLYGGSRSPGHLGDVPHAWIGAEYVLAVLGMFAHERPSDSALVIAAGISDVWLDAGVVVEGLPTWWGPLGYSMRREGTHALRIDMAAAMPPGALSSACRPARARWCASRSMASRSSLSVPIEATLYRWPASVVLRF